MLTHRATPGATTPTFRGSGASTATAQKVVIANGSTEILELLESILDAGCYDIVFVESIAHTYSQIKRVRPDLVILCVRIEDMDGFQVLSMLKLDAETRDIPVLTYTTEYEGQEADENTPQPTDADVLVLKPALPMN